MAWHWSFLPLLLLGSIAGMVLPQWTGCSMLHCVHHQINKHNWHGSGETHWLLPDCEYTGCLPVAVLTEVEMYSSLVNSASTCTSCAVAQPYCSNPGQCCLLSGPQWLCLVVLCPLLESMRCVPCVHVLRVCHPPM
ncbi:hypothetical protein COO60DRAFT_1483902 [Scenedesmus sp. NREL 46B-D3]|nr:hypothetical protein COO60DRAFT_1483902 [Scenedesmus sp. NREL 46B-D3]